MSPHGRKMMVDNRFWILLWGTHSKSCCSTVSHVFSQSVDLHHISTRYGYAHVLIESNHNCRLFSNSQFHSFHQREMFKGAGHSRNTPATSYVFFSACFFCWAGSNRVGWCLLWTMSLWRLGWCACQVWLGRRLTMDCKCLGFVVTQEKSRKTSPKLLGVYQKKRVDTISRAHCWNTLRCVVFIRGIWATTSTHLLLSRSLLSQSHRTSLYQHWESPEWLSGGRTLPKTWKKSR